MTNDSQLFNDFQKTIPLKLPEPEIKANEPWADDALGRAKMAEKMTNLVWMQEDSLVVSLDGDWGTGKTFLLKRWQADLEKEGFKSIYFNAWEDDFCDDPLVAIIGQLSDAFTGSKSEEIVAKIKESAGPLLIQGILGVIRATTGIAISADILKKTYRLDFGKIFISNKAEKRIKTAFTEIVR